MGVIGLISIWTKHEYMQLGSRKLAACGCVNAQLNFHGCRGLLKALSINVDRNAAFCTTKDCHTQQKAGSIV